MSQEITSMAIQTDFLCSYSGVYHKIMYLYGKIVNLTFANAKVPYFETFRSKVSPPSEREDLGGR